MTVLTPHLVTALQLKALETRHPGLCRRSTKIHYKTSYRKIYKHELLWLEVSQYFSFCGILADCQHAYFRVNASETESNVFFCV